jgi:formate hydrogenlyase subunit 3/multisubunit Na+/H+ antiporter MnhD subunit
MAYCIIAFATHVPILPLLLLLLLLLLLCLVLQLPSFDDIRWVSLLGSLMSMAYCIIAFAMSASVRPEPSVSYVPAAVQRSTLDRVMGIFNALTSILFAYGEQQQQQQLSFVCVCGLGLMH